MQSVRIESLTPRNLSDEELAHYATLHAAGELPQAWVEELVRRFTALLDAYEELSLHEPD
jgi:hypothetical protein